ncbi:MAG: hypothetical protein KDJ63_00010 [Nitratireductor sp.]|nr:hypothetical protein [Nitratireductor sp.]
MLSTRQVCEGFHITEAWLRQLLNLLGVEGPGQGHPRKFSAGEFSMIFVARKLITMGAPVPVAVNMALAAGEEFETIALNEGEVGLHRVLLAVPPQEGQVAWTFTISRKESDTLDILGLDSSAMIAVDLVRSLREALLLQLELTDRLNNVLERHEGEA